MWSFLLSMFNKVVAAYTGSPLAQEVVSDLLVDLKEEGAKMLPVAMSAVTAATYMTDKTNTEKFDYVQSQVLNQFSDASRSLVNTVIELTYRNVKKTLS